MDCEEALYRDDLKPSIHDMLTGDELLLCREIVDNIDVGIVVYDTTLRCLLWNRFMEDLTGLHAEQVLSCHVANIRPQLNGVPDERLFRRVLKGEAIVQHETGITDRKSGGERWMSVRYTPKRDIEGHVAGIIIVICDITEQHKAEQAFKQSEERYRQLVLQANDIICETTPNGEFTFFNGDALQRILGYTQQGLLGRNYMDIVRSDYRTEVYNFYHQQFLKKEPTTYFEFPVTAQDGRSVWMGQYVSLILDENGWIVRVQAISRDITERKLAEFELTETSARLRRLGAHMESIREDQSRRLAAEVHDSLGGNLTMLKLGLATMLEKVDEDDAHRIKLESLVSLTDNTIRLAKRITLALRPTMLDTLGLVATIRWHADEFSRMTGIACDLQLPPYIRLVPERSTAVFRIIQEALTNVARHAEAEYVTIHGRKENGHLKIEICDDGKGIDMCVMRNQDSFGIFGMRERARYLHGKLEIVGSGDRGTKVLLDLPLEARDSTFERC